MEVKTVTLDDVILYSQKNKHKILEQHKIFEAFHLSHPWLLMSEITEIAGFEKLSVDEVISFKEHYLVDDMAKIYKQLKLKTKEHLPLNNLSFYFYHVDDGLYKRQQEQGLALGDKDVTGNIVNGSDLTMNILILESIKFLDAYYSRYN